MEAVVWGWIKVSPAVTAETVLVFARQLRILQNGELKQYRRRIDEREANASVAYINPKRRQICSCATTTRWKLPWRSKLGNAKAVEGRINDSISVGNRCGEF